MNISELHLLYAIKHFQIPSQDDLTSYLTKYFKESYIICGNLFFDSYIDVSNFAVLNDYIKSFTAIYAQVFNITDINEIAYLELYFILRALAHEEQYTEIIIARYKILPKDLTSNLLKELSVLIAREMLSYYISENMDLTELQDILEIKDAI